MDGGVGCITLGLASGAEAGATVLHRDPLDGAAANGSGVASLVSNLKIEMSSAILPSYSPLQTHWLDWNSP